MRDQRVWLCLVVILPEWDEVDVFAVAQQSDIFEVHAESVVGRDGDDKRLVVAHMRLCRHQYRCVGDAVCEFCGSVSGAGKDCQRVEIGFGTDGLCAGNGDNRILSGYLFYFSDIGVRCSEAAFDGL